MDKIVSDQELIAAAKVLTQTSERVVIGLCQRIGDKQVFVDTCAEQLERASSPLIRSLARQRLISFLEISNGESAI